MDAGTRRTCLTQGVRAANGGEKKVRRQHDGGKLTVRERIEQLVDPESFREVGGLAGTGQYDADGTLIVVTPSNVIIGRARVRQRPVVVVDDEAATEAHAFDAARQFLS